MVIGHADAQRTALGTLSVLIVCACEWVEFNRRPLSSSVGDETGGHVARQNRRRGTSGRCRAVDELLAKCSQCASPSVSARAAGQ